jgi:MFS family permease
MTKIMRWYDYITINIYYLGLTSISQTLTPLVLPLLVQQFVGTANQGRYYGNLRLWTLMAALLVQALMGMLSDRSTSKWGRRRPFIVAGTVGFISVLILIGLTSEMQGMTGYLILFWLVILQMVTINTAHGAQQGLIPDLVPMEQRGRFSAVKALFEIPIPVILVAITIGTMISKGNLWGGLFTLILIVVIVTVITMFAPEVHQEKSKTKIDWKPFLQLFLMTAIFTIIILGVGRSVEWGIQHLNTLKQTAFLISTALIGTLGIIFAVVIGVWLSTRIALGGEAKGNTSFRWWVVSRLAYLVGATNLVSFAIYFLQGSFGYQGESAARPAANLTMFVGVFILLAALPAGWLADRFGRKPLLVFSGTCAAVGTLLVIISPPSLLLLYIGGILIGMASGVFYSANWALGTRIVPPNQAGKFLGISNLAGAGAGAIGAYIGGPIADMISSQLPHIPGAGYALLFVTYGILFVISALALIGIQDHASLNNEDAI